MKKDFLGFEFADLELSSVTQRLLSLSELRGRGGYVITPNVSHVVRLSQNSDFQSIFSGAFLCLCDSKILSFAHLLTRGVSLKVVRGSDLTEKLLKGADEIGLNLAIVGSDPEDVEFLRARYPSVNFSYHAAPMGLVNNPLARLACVEFIRDSKADIALIAVGMPQQEMIASELVEEKTSTLILCVGASIDFITGKQRRAPKWIRLAGVEWAFRMFTEPRRLGSRYLSDFLPFMILLWKHRHH